MPSKTRLDKALVRLSATELAIENPNGVPIRLLAIETVAQAEVARPVARLWPLLTIKG